MKENEERETGCEPEDPGKCACTAGDGETGTGDELRKCEARFLRAFLASPDGVALSRLSDGRIVDANLILSGFMGYSREEFIQKTALELGVWLYPEDRKRYSQRLSEQEEVTDLETTFRSKEGRLVPVLISGRVVMFRGEPHIVSFVRDISERTYAREALHTLEAHYRTTLDSLGDAIHVVDRDFRITLFNEAAIRTSTTLGIDITGIIGRNLFEIFPFIPDSFRHELETVFATGEPLFTEHFMELQGRDTFSEVKIIPLFEGERVTRAVTVVRDITERKMQVKAIRESEMKYRTLTNNIPDIVCSIDGSGTIVAMNETSTLLTGYDLQEILKVPFLGFIHPDDRDRVARNFTLGISDKKEYTRGLQFRLLKKNGEIMWVELNSHRRFDEDGTFLQEDAILRDFTERKRIEEERARLVRSVEERTAELSAANAELSRAVRAKDEFLASMSHELRTPLSSILSISESLDEEVYGPLTERQRKPVKGMTESGQHLLSLINDILDLSKLEAGKVMLNLVPVNVEELCQASMRLARSQAVQKKLSLSLTLDSLVTTVRADERYLQQILVHLLGNAVKFTPPGGALGLEVKGDTGSQLVSFTVWDKGIGIPPEKRSLLFKPFTQLDGSLSRQYGGTGLGLALVARLTEMHGGTVSLESEPGAGSRFSVTLPWS
jgi:PAS domain S-box-containing protein